MIRRLLTVASVISLLVCLGSIVYFGPAVEVSHGADRIPQTEPSQIAPAAIFQRAGNLADAEHYSGPKFSDDHRALIQITQIGSEQGDDAVKVWNLQTLRPMTALMRDRSILDYGLSGDAKTVFTANPGTIHLWDAATSKVCLTIEASKGDLTSVEMSRDATQLATISKDDECSVVLWRVRDSQPRLRLPHKVRVQWMQFDPTGRWIATLDDHIHIYSTNSGEEIVTPIGWIGFYMSLDGCGFNRTGDRLLIPREQGFVVVPTDGRKRIELDRRIQDFSDQFDVTTNIRFSADGRTVVVTNNAWKAGAAEIYDAATGKLERTVGSHLSDCWIDPSNRWMICFPDLIDLGTGHVVQTFPDEFITAIAPDCSAFIVRNEVWRLAETTSKTK